jgi:hypothetical protein
MAPNWVYFSQSLRFRDSKLDEVEQAKYRLGLKSESCEELRVLLFFEAKIFLNEYRK